VQAETPDWDAQDARDRELLARGAIEELLAAYVDLIRARCRNRCGAHGDDVSQQACLRLWRELSDGKHHDGPKPFREIVNGVVSFACKGWEGTTLGRDTPLEEWTTDQTGSAAKDVADEVMTRIDVEAFVDSLSASDGEVGRLRLVELLEIDQITELTGKTRNAVDQALFRIRRQWKTWLDS
jgi:DNA-directed RNA polymerase specialized sigma24 family protein